MNARSPRIFQQNLTFATESAIQKQLFQHPIDSVEILKEVGISAIAV